MVGRAAMVIAVLVMAGAVHAGPLTRGGVTWTAKPVIVHHDKGVGLGWTITARGTGTSARDVPCVQLDITERYFELDKGKLEWTGGSDRRGEPGNGCAPREKTSVTGKKTWSFAVPPAEHEDLAAGDAVQARIRIWIGGKQFELAAAMLAVGNDGAPKLTALPAGKR